MRWCCGAFQTWFENAGHRGLGVFFVNDPLKPMFIIQWRAVEGEATGLSFPGSIDLVTQTGLQFCPWCGRQLLSWYKKVLKELERPELTVR